jgi:hypothetical protein
MSSSLSHSLSDSPAEQRQIRLSSAGLAQLNEHCYENEFAFIVGDQRHECPLFVADFLSPRISRLRFSDATIREFQVETKDSGEEFKSFVLLGRGGSFSISDENGPFLRQLSLELQNRELFETVSGVIGGGEMSVIDELIFESMAGSVTAGVVERCSSSLFELPTASLGELTVELLSAILSHRSLKLRSENWLYEFVKHQIQIDPQYSRLLEFVRFEYLSSNLISDFTGFISESCWVLTPSLWAALVPRLTRSVFVSVPLPRSDRHLCPTFVPNFDRRFEGMISFLTGECGGNVHDKGLVTVSASGQHWSDCPPGVLVDFESSSPGFATRDADNSWICLTFQNHRIAPTHYSIRSRTDGDCHHLRSWVLEGSHRGEGWKPLDYRTNNCELTGSGGVATFAVSDPCEVTMIRLRQTGPNSSAYHHLIVRSIELFGELLPSRE